MTSNFEKFGHAFRENLRKVVTLYPQEYAWPVDKSDEVANKMLGSIAQSIATRRNLFNKDSRAFEMTCKALGIKHTYSAIYEYLQAA